MPSTPSGDSGSNAVTELGERLMLARLRRLKKTGLRSLHADVANSGRAPRVKRCPSPSVTSTVSSIRMP